MHGFAFEGALACHQNALVGASPEQSLLAALACYEGSIHQHIYIAEQFPAAPVSE